MTTEHSIPEEGRRWWSKPTRSKSNIASCVIMKFVSNTELWSTHLSSPPHIPRLMWRESGAVVGVLDAVVLDAAVMARIRKRTDLVVLLNT